MTRLLKVQGFYYLVTGLWPIVSLRSFLYVTGEKWDLWLVVAMGGLLAASGFGYLIGGQCEEKSPGLGAIAAGQAVVLLLVDVFYVRANAISPIYLFDAIPQAMCLLCWLAILWHSLGENDVSFSPHHQKF